MLLLVGVVGALVGVGWRAQPSDAAVVDAIRASLGAHPSSDLAAVREARIALQSVDRNWLHELVGRGGSRFVALAVIDVPGRARQQGCFRVRPLGPDAVVALGPYSRWHCYSPL